MLIFLLLSAFSSFRPPAESPYPAYVSLFPAFHARPALGYLFLLAQNEVSVKRAPLAPRISCLRLQLAGDSYRLDIRLR